MKRVDEVYPFSVYSTIGPTGTIKRLFRNSDYFQSRGYQINIFANYPTRKRGLFKKKYDIKRIESLNEERKSSDPTKQNKTNTREVLFSRLISFLNKHKTTAALFEYRKKYVIKEYVKDYLKKGTNPDIIVFHDVDSCYAYLNYREGEKAKVVLFLHNDGGDMEMELRSIPILSGSRTFKEAYDNYLFTIKECDRIVFISQLAKEKFISNHPEFRDKVRAVVNGIDDIKPLRDTQPPSQYTYRLVCTGSVCKRKGQYIVLEAMHRMDKRILDQTSFTIIGTGADHDYLVSKAKEYGLDNHITFLGNKPNSEIHRLLSAENIYVLMSNTEGLPISILEAMRAELPIISTRVAGIPEEVDERNGFLIEPDVEQLTNILNSLPKYDWNQLGKNSRDRFEKEFRFEIMRKKYADLFDDLK